MRMDVEGAEWDVLAQWAEAWPPIRQLLIEVHMKHRAGEDLFKTWAATLRALPLRLFAAMPNDHSISVRARDPR